MAVKTSPFRIDLRELPPPRRHGLIFRTFAGLAPGESFLIVNDHDPRPLLHQFQFEHAGAYDWFPWQEGPGAWVIEIARREGGFRRTVTDFMAADHHFLDTHFALACEAADAGDWAAVALHAAVFHHGMKRHLHIEEDWLIPAYRTLVGNARASATAQMTFDHAQIQGLLAEWVAAAGRRDAAALEAQTDLLLSVLGPHNSHEDRLLYPTIDQLLEPHEANRLVLEMQAA
jgi:uncharacterized protein (DUF2249 family)